jgi:lycopene cyclase domain-containing protein
MKQIYLIVDIASVIVPLIFSFHPKLRFDRHWRSTVRALMLTAMPFVLWDILYTHLGVWGFNPHYITGVYIANLPLEELLFFLCIPYSCLFSYHCFTVLFPRDYFGGIQDLITVPLGTVLLLSSIYFYDRLYTAAACGLCGAFLLWLRFGAKQQWLGRFYFCFLFLLVPFFIVNGILTGTGLEQPVVWYDDNENLGLRMLTIPVEDTFYGMLMLITNVYFYERHIARTKTR